MNTKESLELVYLRLVAQLVKATENRMENPAYIVSLLEAIDKIQYLVDMEEEKDALPDLMCQVPAPGSEQAERSPGPRSPTI